jgi:hypothetical protein
MAGGVGGEGEVGEHMEIWKTHEFDIWSHIGHTVLSKIAAMF